MSEKRYIVQNLSKAHGTLREDYNTVHDSDVISEIPAGAVLLTREQVRAAIHFWMTNTINEPDDPNLTSCLDELFGKEAGE